MTQTSFTEAEIKLINILSEFDWDFWWEQPMGTDWSGFLEIADSDEQVIHLDFANGYETICEDSSWGFVASHLGQDRALDYSGIWGSDQDERYEDFWQMVADKFHARISTNNRQEDNEKRLFQKQAYSIIEAALDVSHCLYLFSDPFYIVPGAETKIQERIEQLKRAIDCQPISAFEEARLRSIRHHDHNIVKILTLAAKGELQKLEGLTTYRGREK